MPNIAPNLKSKLQTHPDAKVNLIIRTKDDPQSHFAEIQKNGLTVRRTFSLISAVAVEGTASASLALVDQPWVLSVEEDKPVHTM